MTTYEIDLILISERLPPLGKPVTAVLNNETSFTAVRYESKAQKGVHLWGLVSPNPKFKGIIYPLENVVAWIDLKEARPVQPILEKILDEAETEPAN